MFILDTIFDTAMPNQINFQQPATTIRERIILLHHDLLFLLIIIATLVTWLLFRTVYLYNSAENKDADKEFTHHSLLEITWTTVPCLILFSISVPSFSLLYARDEYYDPGMVVKVIGNQWYWTYELSTARYSYEFDATLLDISECTEDAPYRLATSHALILPTDTHIRFLISASDVLHSWAVPCLGIKRDACPGRLNQVFTFIKRPGLYYGQCSEICGSYHGYMPIEIRAISVK